jgi:glycosyltransferase involved in cell wall biosynthesis
MPLSEIFGEDMAEKKVLLYTGGIDAIKGGDYILDSFTSDIKGEEYRLLMVGCKKIINNGWKHKIKCLFTHFGYYYRELEMQHKADADKRIRRIDSVYELNHLIEQSHCFVSYYRMPHANLALAENIILGNPCIAADTEEAQEYSGDGKYAMLVAPLNDRKAFSSKLLLFLRDINKWQQAVKEGADVIKEVFDPQKNINILVGALRGLFS